VNTDKNNEHLRGKSNRISAPFLHHFGPSPGACVPFVFCVSFVVSLNAHADALFLTDVALFLANVALFLANVALFLTDSRYFSLVLAISRYIFTCHCGAALTICNLPIPGLPLNIS